MNAKKLGFGLMRLPQLDANDAGNIDIEQLNKTGAGYFDYYLLHDMGHGLYDQYTIQTPYSQNRNLRQIPFSL